MKLLITVLALAAFAFSQEAAAPASPAKEKKAAKVKVATVEVKGTVVSVDAVANTVVVKTEAGEQTLNVEKETKISAGKVTTLAELKAETLVVCKVKEVDGKKVAVSIKEKMEKKAAKKAAAAESPAAK